MKSLGLKSRAFRAKDPGRAGFRPTHNLRLVWTKRPKETQPQRSDWTRAVSKSEADAAVSVALNAE